jgi:acyl-CoA synthetase (NDP forming)
VVKIGRSEAGRRAAVHHTASDTGIDAEFDALFERHGILRADDVDDMLDLAAYFSTTQQLPHGRRVGVLTTSGGAGAWLADACSTHGFELPIAEPDLQSTVRSFIPPYGSTVNPIDITAQAVFGGGFERALNLMSGSPSFDVVVGVGSMVREERFLSSVHDLHDAIEGARVPIVFYAYTRPSRRVLVALRGLGIPCYSTPGRAARVMAAAHRYQQFLSARAQEGLRV